MKARRKNTARQVMNPGDALPFASITADFLKHKEFAPKETQRAYRGDLERLAAFLMRELNLAPSAVKFRHVTRSALEHWRDELTQHEAPATVRRRIATVRTLFQFAADAHETPNRVGRMRLPKIRTREFKGLSESEYTRTLELAANEPPCARFTIELLAHTGLRRSEATAITMANLDSDWRFIRDIKGKGGYWRTIPVSAELARCLTRYMDYRRNFPLTGPYPLLVSETRSKTPFPATWRVDEKTVWRVCHKVMLEAGVAPDLCHPHTLRHTFARRTLEELGAQVGTSRALTVVMKLLGHSDLSTTVLYLGNGDDEVYALMKGR